MDLPGSAIPVFPYSGNPAPYGQPDGTASPSVRLNHRGRCPWWVGPCSCWARVCPGAVTRKLPLFPFAGL